MPRPDTGVLEHLNATLADRYAIQRELGRGGMATVYLARDLKHDREIALKVLHPEITATLGSDRFLREIRIAAKLSHPRIVALYDSGEAGSILYYVMPYIAGESLRHRLKRDKQLAIDDAVNITQQVASALHYAHCQGLVHRDIKPENILLHEGEATVADFGIALALSAAGGERLTQTGVAIGTPEYMSPEQISASEELDARSDVYALGCVLYEMLTGEPPYMGATARAVMAKHLTDAVPTAGRLRASVTPAIDLALSRALAKSPADRFRTVTELAEALVSGGGQTDVAAAMSLVVLPFANLSADAETEAFCDGLTEEIIADLSKIDAIRVTSRTSAMRLKGTEKELKTIGRELKVRYVLEGSVRKAGNNLRITAQLIDATNDTHLWAEKYSGTLDDIFDIQEQVARSIAGALRVKLTPREEEQIAQTRQSVSEGFRSHLWGRYHWYRFTPDGVQKAREYFERALERDPAYAAAHVGLADSYLMLGGAPLNVLPSAEAVPIARRAAVKAIELDPSNGGAYESLALVQCWFDGDWEAARRTAIRGTEVDPGSGLVWTAYAHTHDVCGMHDEAIRGAARATELDPVSPLFNVVAALAHSHARSYAQAEQFVRKAFELEPRFPVAAWVEGEILLAQGDDAGALAAVAPWRDAMGDFDYGSAIVGVALARNGRREEALRIGADLEELCSVGRGSWASVALVHLALGDRESALTFVQRAAHQKPFGSQLTAYLAVNALFDPLRKERVFKEALRALGLDFYARTDTASAPSHQS